MSGPLARARARARRIRTVWWQTEWHGAKRRTILDYKSVTCELLSCGQDNRLSSKRRGITGNMLDSRSNTARCSFSNGKRPFLAADGRSPQGRLLRDREYELAAPLGGLEALSLGERLKVQAAALLSVRLELARSELARGESMTTTNQELVRISNALSRELADLNAAAARSNQPALASRGARRNSHPNGRLPSVIG